MRRTRVARAADIEGLADALTGVEAGVVTGDPRVQVAAKLRRSPGMPESSREHLRGHLARMFEAGEAAGCPTAGTRDLVTTEAHVAQVDLPHGGGRVVLADVEALPPDRAARVAYDLAMLHGGVMEPREK